MRLAAQAKGWVLPDSRAGGRPDRRSDTHPVRLLPPGAGDHPHPRPLLRGRGRAPEAGREARPAQLDVHRDLRRRAAQGPGGGGREPAPPHPGLGPVRHVDSERGLRPAAPEPALRLRLGGQADGARLPDPHHALPGRGRPAGLHRAQAAPGGVGPLPVHPLRAVAVLGLPRPGAGVLRPGGAHGLPQGGPRSRRGRREHGHRVVDRGAGAAALPARPLRLRGVHPRHVAQRRRAVHHPHRRSRRRGDRGAAGRGCGRTRTSPTPSGPPGTPAPAR